jgi:HK97 family phage major capsid protein
MTSQMHALDLVRAQRQNVLAEREPLIARMEQAAEQSLAESRSMTNAETKAFRDAKAQVGRLDVELAELDEREAELLEVQERTAERAKRPSLSLTAATREFAGGTDYDRARYNIDHAARAGHLPDYAAERTTALIESGPAADRSIATRWAATAGHPAYRTAFAKLLADPTRGHLLWTPEEADAYRAAAAVNAEMRAMDTTSGTGAEMIPLSLDPAILLTNAGSANPLRALARVVQTTTNAWTGVTSAGVSAEWKAESAEVADATPTLAAPKVDIFTGDAFVPYSFEVGMDADNFLQELTAVLVDSADQLQATAFTTGNGTTAPQGIVTGLAGTSSEINTSGSEALDKSDPFRLQNDLGARFSANAVFLSNVAVANTYRQMETTNGALYFPELRQDPPQLAGKPWFELSNMDGTINAAATANNYLLVYGDVRAGFIIADRIGTTLELIPNMVGANNRPTGERGALLWFRTGSKVVVPAALRLLDVPTTA